MRGGGPAAQQTEPPEVCLNQNKLTERWITADLMFSESIKANQKVHPKWRKTDTKLQHHLPPVGDYNVRRWFPDQRSDSCSSNIHWHLFKPQRASFTFSDGTPSSAHTFFLAHRSNYLTSHRQQLSLKHSDTKTYWKRWFHLLPTNEKCITTERNQTALKCSVKLIVPRAPKLLSFPVLNWARTSDAFATNAQPLPANLFLKLLDLPTRQLASLLDQMSYSKHATNLQMFHSSPLTFCFCKNEENSIQFLKLFPLNTKDTSQHEIMWVK